FITLDNLEAALKYQKRPELSERSKRGAQRTVNRNTCEHLSDCISMMKKAKVLDPTAAGQGGIKRRSKVPGVMITQYVEELPEGMTTPDFTRKPIALTIQEGKLAIFKAKVSGNPTPTVSWRRAKGEIKDPQKFQIPKVTSNEADTYKCYAINEHGKAVCTVVLNIIEVGFKKEKEMQKAEAAPASDPTEFRKKLRKGAGKKTEEKKEGDIDDAVWELLLSSEKKDYERICSEYGVTDFRGMLKKLVEMKKEREEEQAQFIQHLSNLKPIEVKSEEGATFELEMELKDPNSHIFLYKDGVMIPYSKDAEGDLKHGLKQVGKKYIFTVKNLKPEDAGIYQVDVEGVNIFSTDFKIPPVDFALKIKEVTAQEREDALFECVLTQPTNAITWTLKNIAITNSEKYEITVSEDKLIHSLKIIDCMPLDAGIYAAIAGIKSCNAWLIVEADKDPKGKKTTRKTTQAGGGGEELQKIAAEQAEKSRKEMAEAVEAARKLQAEREAAEAEARAEARAKAEAEAEAAKAAAKEALAEAKGKSGAEAKGNGGARGAGTEGGATGAGRGGDEKRKQKKDGPLVPDTVKGITGRKNAGTGDGSKPSDTENQSDKENSSGSGNPSDSGNQSGSGNHSGSDNPSGSGNSTGSGSASGSGDPPGPGKPSGPGGPSECGSETTEEDEKDESAKAQKRAGRKNQGSLVPETAVDPGVYFSSGLEDCKAIIGEGAELVCKLSSAECEGVWSKDGTEADGRKTECAIAVEDPPRFSAEEIEAFTKPIVIKQNQRATFKIPFIGREPCKVQWYKDGEELLPDTHCKIEILEGESRLLLSKLQRKDTGEIKIKIKNEFGTVEAFTSLVVLDKPTPPLGPLEIVEASSNCVEIKWRPPKDDGGCPIHHYVLERNQIGRNTWKKIGQIPGEAHYKDTDVDHGRRYCYRIRAETDMGTSELMETEDVQAGTKAAPKVVSAFKDCINLSWTPPTNTGGTNILGYNLEKRKKGSNLWGHVNPLEEPIKAKKYAVKDVVEGMEYEFRISAINISGAGEPSAPSEFVFARDPKKPPGKVTDLKVTDSSYTTLSLSWTKPKEEPGVQDEAKGYFIDIRLAENQDWDRCNQNAVTMTSFTVKRMKSMAMYWVRVCAVNEGGEGEPQELDNYILAMPPPVRPRFTDIKIKSFMVVRAGNSARFNINFEASPWPDVIWLKDGIPVSKRVTISNAEGASQILIPSAERSDTGIYTILVKNIVGQETFSIEIRVTDEPKPPGPVELDENVPGTVTVSWEPSPDEKRDDRLHYMVTKRDSSKRTWHPVADRIFNNRFTACNIMPGREYQFRVYSKNDIGLSAPSESPKWLITSKKEKFTLNMPESKTCNLEKPPRFMVPLKIHTAPQGYECYISCAVRGDPTPHITWYHNNVSLNTNTNYLITNTCGVCSMLILRVGAKDMGEYKVIAENPLGRAECSTNLTTKTIILTLGASFSSLVPHLKEESETLITLVSLIRTEVAIKKRSKVPGVMITQYVETIPVGKNHPDFSRKPIALTIQEGKFAFFKAIVTGDPTPTVTWARNNGEVSDPEKYILSFDPILGEHQLQMPNVGVDQADTYKCLATNEFGRAIVTVTLNVIEVGFKKSKAMQEARIEQQEKSAANLKKTLRTRNEQKQKKDGEVDEKFWELLLSADKKDYERICAEYGITDFRWMLKKLNEKKREIEEQQAQYIEHLGNLKHIEIKTPGCAQFEFEMDLKDPNARVFLFKDGVMVPFDVDTAEKHSLKKIGRKYVFIPMVDFLVKIQEVKALERQDAVFECVLSAPFSKISWLCKNIPLEQGEKFDITVSEDLLIHRLVVKDCMQLDKGIYTAMAGMKSCSAWLIVDADPDPNQRGKKAVRKTTQAGGGGADLVKIAAEQQEKLQKERAERIEQIKQIQAEQEAAKQEEKTPEPELPKQEPEPVAEPLPEVQEEKPAETAPLPAEEEPTTEEPKKRVRTGPLVPDTIIDPGVHFTCGLSDVHAIIGQSAEMICKLSSDKCDGIWYKEGKEITETDDMKFVKDGAVHKIIFTNCTEDDNGKYRFEADGRKTEALLVVEDPPRINLDDLANFSKPVIIKVGQNATFKLEFVGREPIKIQWYNEGEELLEDNRIKIERSESHSRLLLVKCQRKDSGEIKLKLKNEFGTIEALSKLIVLDKPTNPMGPVDVIEASASCVDFKWRAPKDDGGSPVINYNLERNQIGRNTWMKLGNIPPDPHYKDNDVDHGRRYCYRIRAVTAQGISDVYETNDIQAGTKVVSAFKNCITLAWSPPTNTGGTNIVGYNMEKRKRGSNLWGQVNAPDQPIKGKQYDVKDVVEGMEYEFRVSAINFSGAGEPSTPSEFVIARDPKKPPGKVIDLKVTDSTYTSLSLSWTKPKEEEGVQDEAKGYFVELRPAESTEWGRCNSTPLITTSYTILGLKSMAMYWVRVVATNEGGDGQPRDLDNYIIAMPPPVRPNFTDRKMKSFFIVRAENSARVNINFEASPIPTIIWLKDGMPVSKRVTISNADNMSQLLIPSAERSDSGIYSIIVKNMVGQETFSVEIRVTDDPKPPGPVELEENVPGTLTVSWEPSPDEKRDNHLHYMVMKRDTIKRTWQTVADRLYNNIFTAVNIAPGREYNFRVYAKNDIGLSEPSESLTWGVVKKREKFILNMPPSKTCNFNTAPLFTVPLKTHATPEKYECYMSCAVKGDPKPHVTWYRNNVSLNTNINYYISNTCGVCSMLILRVGAKDNGEYKVVAENSLGRAESSTLLTILE
ncbi:hypothetical protein DNTS_015305, partial [Danionella cerebrum]